MKYFLLLFCVAWFAGSLLHPDASYAQGARLSFSASFGGVTFTPGVKVGAMSEKTFTITNRDTAKSAHGHIDAPHTASFVLLSLDTFSLGPREVDTVHIRFMPQSVGTLRDTLVITHDGDTTGFTKNPVRIALSGSGIAANDTTDRIAVSSRFIFFNKIKVDSSATMLFSIRNVTDTARNLHGVVTGPHTPFSIDTAGIFNIPLPTKDTAFYHIKFSPTDTGTFRDSLVITSNADSANARIVISIFGTAISDSTSKVPVDTAKAYFSVKSIAFDSTNIGTSGSTKTFVLRNVSTSNVVLTGTVTTPAATFTFSPPGPITNMHQSDSVTYIVTFKPQVATTYSDSIVFLMNTSIETRRVVIHLNGTGKTKTVQQSVEPSATEMLKVATMPNPASDKIAVLANGALGKNVTVTLSDITGRTLGVIFSGRVSSESQAFDYEVRNLPAGMYLIRMQTERETIVTKLLVQH